MNTTRVLALFALTLTAPGVMAETIWLKDRQGNVCYNSASTNPGQVVGYGGVNRDGTGFTFTISNPANGTKTPATGDCASAPTAPANAPIVISGSVPTRLNAVHAMKPGTNQAVECLDQGTNLSGLSGVIGGSGYRLVFSTQFTDGCNMQTQTAITPNGQPSYTRTLSIFRSNQEAPLMRGQFHIFNVASVPEPDTLLLLAMGGLGLGWAYLGRRRARNQG